MIDFLQKNIIAIIGVCIGIIGIVYGLYRDRKKEKTPAYLIEASTIIRKPSLDKLEILYKQKKVDSLVSSKIILLNEGKIPIEKKDVPEDYPITIIPRTNVEIYDSSIIYASKPSNQISIEQSNNKIKVFFDYLNKNDGVVIQILHSLPNRKIQIQYFDIQCEVKGVEKLKTISAPNDYDLIKSISIFALSVGFWVLLIELLTKLSVDGILNDVLFALSIPLAIFFNFRLNKAVKRVIVNKTMKRKRKFFNLISNK
jgi:hypothetical protein